MIEYLTLGTNNLERGAKFYDAIAAELGAQRMIEEAQLIAWGTVGGKPDLGLIVPIDGKPATVGNGVMIAMKAATRGDVDRVHRLAVSLGGIDEGPPGLRSETHYAAYFRDLDG